AGKVDGRDRFQLQRIAATAAVEQGFGAAISDNVGAGAGVDDVRAAGAVDGVVAGATHNGIGDGAADDVDALRGAKRAGVDILEIHHRGGVTDGLVHMPEVEIGYRQHD